MKAEDIEDFEDLLEDAENNAISDWDMRFVADIKEKYDDQGGDAVISMRQLEQLERIVNQ